MFEEDQKQRGDDGNFPRPDVATDDRPDAQKKADKELALRLSSLIEDANLRVTPLCKLIRKVR
jgi:hypothetical protein